MYIYNVLPFHSQGHKLTCCCCCFLFSLNLAFSLIIHDIYVASIIVKTECYIQPFFPPLNIEMDSFNFSLFLNIEV